MTNHTPASTDRIARFIDVADVASVAAAGWLSFWLRDPNAFSDDYLTGTMAYCIVGFLVGLAMLAVHDLGRDVRDFVSLRDAQIVVTAAVSTAALTSGVVFLGTRLESVPRSLPVIHAIVLTLLLFCVRVVAVKRREIRERRARGFVGNRRHVLVVGANRLAFCYFKMIEMLGDSRNEIVGVLDDDPQLIGRSMLGCVVLARPADLDRIAHEFSVHGVSIDRVIVSGSSSLLDDPVYAAIRDCCAANKFELVFLADQLGFAVDEAESPADCAEVAVRADFFIRMKRAADLAVALSGLVLALPLIALVSVGVFLDVGWPLVFWQKRDGLGGRPFLIYKFRTLRAPFDRRGRFVAEDARTSSFGRFLRRVRLDELPQLWNVIVGEMSFIGPRPLLPVDQPATSRRRLEMRPGITGWAQIHGGKMVSADEKGVLDDWYVENASFALDARIIWRTFGIVFLGDQRVADAIQSDASVAASPFQISELTTKGTNNGSIAAE